MLEKAAADTLQSYRNSMNGWKINEALKGVWTFVRSMNKYIDVTMPWVLAKSQDKAPVLDAVLYHLCEGLRITSPYGGTVHSPSRRKKSGTSWDCADSRKQH